MGNVWVDKTNPSISEEKMEEYRMLSGFKNKEIQRVYKSFLVYSSGSDFISRHDFENIEGIRSNPLKDRIAICFGFDDEKPTIDFIGYLIGLSVFNSPGKRELKLKAAFKMQDFDGDGVINRNDISEYLRRITANSISEEELVRIVDNIFQETASDVKKESISYADFQRVVAPSDFHTKLLLPI